VSHPLSHIDRRLSLRPFFSYFGCKWNLARNYPAPLHPTIIEPFAGAAGYATWHFERNVILYDCDPAIVALWNYLISTPKSEILKLPLLFTSTHNLDIPDAAKTLLGFWIARGRSTPAIVPSQWNRTGLYTTSFWSAEKRQRIAEQVEHIRHWKCYQRRYGNVPNTQATWFIDPPYQKQGHHYKHSWIEYEDLACWVKTRSGQVIVTEQAGADWLPFTQFQQLRGVCEGGKRRTMEMIYTQ
jgi:site-specific DNA-adenine methylase